MRKVLLNSKSGKESVNHNNIIPVELNRDVSLFHDELLTDTIDTMQVYNDEKDKSTKHRLIFTLYPLCSNSLFNKITEVVYKEGSSEASAATVTNNIKVNGAISTQAVNRIQAIRNTEYSNEKFNITYHCGADIFNNHLLRMKEPVSVQKRSSSSADKKGCDVYSGTTSTKVSSNQLNLSGDSFNTIGDYCRNSNGKVLKTYFPNSSKSYTYDGKHSAFLPLYMYDTISTFKEAYADGIKRKDGWMGFYNPTTLHIPASGTTTNGYYVNKCINNKEACEFINMTPEKELFYFTPLKNTYRNRLEYNWDYFLTYPAESVYNDGVVLIGKGQGLPIGRTVEQLSTNGLNIVSFRSNVKHNLVVGDYVNLKFDNGQNIKCRVTKIGNSEGKYTDFYFSVRKDDFDEGVVASGVTPIRFAKVVNGFECEYYFRKFKKFDTDYKSTLNKLAFSNTIYGDEVSQLVYTDDIDLEGYVDNRGRPLTEIYLTILKANRGYKDWYNNNKFNLESIEYSHVFGSVTSGLDVPYFAGRDFPTLRFQHNIKPSDYNKVEISPSSKFLESDITNAQTSFYGDLVEFNPVTVTETTLEVVKHRFNTAQRECKNSNYNILYHDEIYGDNYDSDRYGKAAVSGNTRIRVYGINEGYANIAPEGYIYNPHHKISIGEYDNVVRQMSDMIIEGVQDAVISNGATVKKITFKTKNNYMLLQYDVISLVDKTNGNLYQYMVNSYVLNNGLFECSATLIGSEYPSTNPDNFWFFKHNLEIPTYAYMLPDGTGRHLWRDRIAPSALSFMSDLYNIPFTNGAFYHHINITFPVKRQDPFHKFEMFVKKDGVQLENNFEVPTTELDTTGDEYIYSNDNSASCF